MPTKPIDEIYPESAGNAKVLKILGRWAEGIQESVRFGSHVMHWCSEAKVYTDERALPVLLSFRHALELLDSISVLISYGLADPCKILLRCLFETCLSIEYILQKNTERRAMSFLVWHVKCKRKSYTQMVPGSTENKQWKARLKKEDIGRNVAAIEIDDIEKYIKRLDGLLVKSGYKEAAEEYERIRKKTKRNPNWFQLFDGPRNVQELAERLGHPALYEVLYRTFSGPTHGTDVINKKISPGIDGFTKIVQIRFCLFAQNATSLALSFATSSFRTMVDFHVPKKRATLNEWYQKEIRDLQMWLISGEIIKES